MYDRDSEKQRPLTGNKKEDIKRQEAKRLNEFIVWHRGHKQITAFRH